MLILWKLSRHSILKRVYSLNYGMGKEERFFGTIEGIHHRVQLSCLDAMDLSSIDLYGLLPRKFPTSGLILKNVDRSKKGKENSRQSTIEML